MVVSSSMYNREFRVLMSPDGGVRGSRYSTTGLCLDRNRGGIFTE
jgi:hypothetical protein